MTKKQFILSVVVAAIIIIIAAGVISKCNNDKLNAERIEEQKKELKKISDAAVMKAQKKDVFNTNEEIKEVYGRIETVYLWNGKTYTGAVVSNNNIYQIVTTEGTKVIPIKDVKLREMIK